MTCYTAAASAGPPEIADPLTILDAAPAAGIVQDVDRRSTQPRKPAHPQQISCSACLALGATLLWLRTAACGGTVSGQAEPTAGIADPKLDTTTPKLPKIGDCTTTSTYDEE